MKRILVVIFFFFAFESLNAQKVENKAIRWIYQNCFGNSIVPINRELEFYVDDVKVSCEEIGAINPWIYADFEATLHETDMVDGHEIYSYTISQRVRIDIEYSQGAHEGEIDFVGFGHDALAGGDEVAPSWDGHVIGTIYLNDPTVPLIDILLNQHVFKSDSLNYDVCNCDCSTAITTDYHFGAQGYQWRIVYKRKTVLYNTNGGSLALDVKSLGLQAGDKIEVSYLPLYEGITFKESDPITLTVKAQSEFETLKSGNKVDVYPGFGKDWSQSGWICTFMPNIPQNEESIYVCSSGLNGELNGCDKIEGLYVKDIYLRTGEMLNPNSLHN